MAIDCSQIIAVHNTTHNACSFLSVGAPPQLLLLEETGFVDFFVLYYCCYILANATILLGGCYVEDILRDIGVIARALDSISNIEFKEINLTKGQFIYLTRICENPGIIQEKLAEMLKIDRTTASRAIKNLEKNHMIVKKNDATNKKNKLLFPTEKGKSLYPFIIRENNHSNAVALQGFSQKEITDLSLALKRVKQNISEDWSKVKKGYKRKY